MNADLHISIPWPVWRTILSLLPAIEEELKTLERLLQILAELLSRQQASQETWAEKTPPWESSPSTSIKSGDRGRD